MLLDNTANLPICQLSSCCRGIKLHVCASVPVTVIVFSLSSGIPC